MLLKKLGGLSKRKRGWRRKLLRRSGKGWTSCRDFKRNKGFEKFRIKRRESKLSKS